MGEVTQYDMRIYQGIPGRGGSPYGEQASFTLMKATGETEAAKEPETMEPAEIPTEKPTEPEIVEEPVEEAIAPEPEEPEEEAPSEEAAPMEEAAPEPVVEEEPEPAEEEKTPPEPEPAPESTGVKFMFDPETPYLTDGTEPVIVSGQISGITESTTTRFYLNVVRSGGNGTTIPVADAPLNPEGDRTATIRSLQSNLQVF